ncbi:MmoB/DmpM family protein [Marinobacter sp. M3C]|jgi:phenol hydroxylase P2 protein|uniref:MmoB/DmpM family protein n=1 Tax=Marinobacter sp. M3C TaxID=2917715 RepID=UPI00200F5DAD|nr:MmoB/DmpM family protein [Marinobacter sp. M3C]MCL1477247.1 MmoB/DmpM family protein [Marinobacter sp.]MCL1480723.1 MmoB/DmpM family protein [Marinobacter sp.]MCL1485914.1 MmoB/DmpM family protein [Marinobacter sp.]MCL1486833.1 MmoB/DmpM family protein [Marinobacter sp.]UQG62408.1 MmoB/DmpM family protein [Marinobacter sp. M3C]
MSQKVFMAFQDNDNARYLLEAIVKDNPEAEVQHSPAMIRITAEKRLVINRETMEETLGRDWEVQEMLLEVISIGGNVDEDDDHFIISWS